MLVDKVLKQIKSDVADGDLEALAELLEQCPVNVLNSYLSEEEQEQHN